MEEDDEFGDLYSDVLRPFASSSSTSFDVQNRQPTFNHSSVRTPVDLNRKSDEDGILFGAPNADSVVSVQATNKTLPPMAVGRSDQPTSVGIVSNSVTGDYRKGFGVENGEGLAGKDMKLQERVPGSGISDIQNQKGLKGSDYIEKDVRFDIEEGNTGAEIEGLDPIIPGLSTSGSVSIHGSRLEGARQNAVSGATNDGDDDWDSDSEDDLQIVLNDNNHRPLPMERGGMVGDDEDEDEDGAPLVILADGDPNQPMQEQEWGEDAGQAVDAERKEMAEAGKASGGMALTGKIGYGSLGYHPFHSQFKYVRPGAAPIPSTPGLGEAPGQVRPLLNVSSIAGRGRGDWRPPAIDNTTPMQKGFNAGFGVSAWGNNMAGRGYGSGLDFNLPSHKTIFEVDIDGFEEKPWKYPGVDLSDFFNFSLNEDNWKEYCKQLEQLRHEATMQSKIRVYESGRTEQEYDPDLPPELAAAAGIHDIAAENANPGKSFDLQNDLGKGAARMQSQLPAGRAIQVESSYGERLPSIDTRPPRMRDLDAIIEIVLQDSVDDDISTENCTLDQLDNDSLRNDLRGDQAQGRSAHVDIEDPDDFSQDYSSGNRDHAGRRSLPLNSDDIPERKEVSPFLREGRGHSPNSRSQSPIYYGESSGSPYEERKEKGRARDHSPHTSPSRIVQDGNVSDNEKEGSVESIDDKQSPLIKAIKESSVEIKDADYDELAVANGKSDVEKDTYSDAEPIDSTLNEERDKKHEDINDREDLKAARSSENSGARSGSSRDDKKWRDEVDEEVVQDKHAIRMGSVNRDFDESEKKIRRKVHDERQVGERNRMMVKVKDDSYPQKQWDPTSVHQLCMKTESFDRRREGDSDGAWHRRDDAPYYGGKQRAEDARKREHGDEIGAKNRGKVYESEWHGKNEDHLRFDNGNYRIHYDKNVNSQNKERDDNLKSRYENMDDYHSKRRKAEEHLKRDYIDREEHLHGLKESSNHRKRERNEVFDPRKRDDLQKIRENVNDNHSTRHKDEWSQREREDRMRERDELQRVKPSYEENMNKQERDKGRRVLEEKGRPSHAKVKDEYKVAEKEYHMKDSVRHSEHSKKKERIEHESSHQRGRENVYARGNQLTHVERRSRQERSSSRTDRAINPSDNRRMHDKKHKENTRKHKEPETDDHNTIGPLKRSQEDQSGYNNETGGKDSRHHGIDEHASLDDEQRDSRGGRSKLEHWTSHNERDFNAKSKSISSLKLKDNEKNNNGGSSEAIKQTDDSSKTIEAIDHNQLAEEKDAKSKPLEDRHLDTVEKLKKRNERFKLPMPSEKEGSAIKKMDNDTTLPSTASEAPLIDSDIKPDRPARKRRWISK